VLLVGHVQLHLVRAVGLELARVAAQVDWVDAGQEPELPLVLRSALLDVVDMAEALKMLVSFAVELEVGLQIGAVVAQVTEVVAADDNGHLILSGPAAVM